MIHVRPATEDDLRFVRASWVRSFWEHGGYDAPSFKLYMDHMPQLVERAIEHTYVQVAAFDSAPTEVLAWACGLEQTLFWAYTKKDFRQQGLQRKLCAGLVQYAIKPRIRAGKALVRNMSFNPFVMMEL